MFEILETQPDLPDGTRDAARAARCTARSTFEDVHFGYDASREVLRGVDFHARAGELIAIVGATGAGKTTLVSLIPRFYDPTAGRVLLDGIDVREFRLRALRQQVAMVLQQPLVFPTTVRENIAYGSPDATPARDRRGGAAGAARRLPRRACRRGSRRSSASRARRCRAASSSASRSRARSCATRRILILDEPTAALDADHRGARAGRARAADGGTHDVRHRASALDGAARGRHPGAGGRSHRGAGDVRRAGRPRRATSPACTRRSSAEGRTERAASS